MTDVRSCARVGVERLSWCTRSALSELRRLSYFNLIILGYPHGRLLAPWVTLQARVWDHRRDTLVSPSCTAVPSCGSADAVAGNANEGMATPLISDVRL